MHKFLLAFHSVAGILSLIVGTYISFEISHMVPILFDLHGTLIGGLAPVAMGAGGVWFLFMAYHTGKALSYTPELPDKPWTDG